MHKNQCQYQITHIRYLARALNKINMYLLHCLVRRCMTAKIDGSHTYIYIYIAVSMKFLSPEGRITWHVTSLPNLRFLTPPLYLCRRLYQFYRKVRVRKITFISAFLNWVSILDPTLAGVTSNECAT